MRKMIALFAMGITVTLAACDTAALQQFLAGLPQPATTPKLVPVKVTIDGGSGSQCCDAAPFDTPPATTDKKVPVTFVIDPTPSPAPTSAPTTTSTTTPATTPTPEWHGKRVPEGEYIPPVVDLDGNADQFTFENDQRTIAQRAFVTFYGNTHGNPNGENKVWYTVEWGDTSTSQIPDPPRVSYSWDEYYRLSQIYRSGYIGGNVVCVAASGSHRIRRVCGTLKLKGASYQPSDWTVTDDPPVD